MPSPTAARRPALAALRPRHVRTLLTLVNLLGLAAAPLAAQSDAVASAIPALERQLPSVMPKVVAWRRDIHANPELAYEEHRTAALVAEHLRGLGLEVRTGVGRTGVVGILRGARPGPTVALRADMDALPVTELADVPFASRVKAQWQGREVGVMHACGHDNHVAILMGAAEVLAGMRGNLAGTVLFIFQPAEEGMSGAQAMVNDGVLRDPRPDAIFGLHVWPARVGTIAVRPGPTMAAAGDFSIVVKGVQTHGSQPWSGVDPIIVSAQVLLGLQTIVSRQINLSYLPAVLTVGQIEGGNRSNIIPDSVVMVGTLRTFDDSMRADIARRITRTAEEIAGASGATARVRVNQGGLVTDNDSSLTARMMPTLRRAGRVTGLDPVMASEDFPVFTQEIPSVYFVLGIVPEGQDPRTAPPNHSPLFFADEGALEVGVRAMVGLAVDYLRGGR